MSLTARICTHHDQPWMVIEAAPRTLGGEPTVVYDGPLNLHSKATTKAEIDFYSERSGIDRPTLYDAVREYKYASRHGESGRPAGRGKAWLGEALQGSPAQASSASQSAHNQSPNLRGRKER